MTGWPQGGPRLEPGTYSFCIAGTAELSKFGLERGTGTGFRTVQSRPLALVRESSQYAFTHRTKCPLLEKRHACRMLGTEMLAGKSYFGKTGRKRVSIAASLFLQKEQESRFALGSRWCITSSQAVGCLATASRGGQEIFSDTPCHIFQMDPPGTTHPPPTPHFWARRPSKSLQSPSTVPRALNMGMGTHWLPVQQEQSLKLCVRVL